MFFEEINGQLLTRHLPLQCYTTMGLEESDYSFFVKMMPSSHIHYNDRGKFIAQKTGSFKREIEANFCFLRSLNQFIKEQATDAGLADPIRTPEIVYGSHDEAGNGVIVWINETAAHGFKPTCHCRYCYVVNLLENMVRQKDLHKGIT